MNNDIVIIQFIFQIKFTLLVLMLIPLPSRIIHLHSHLNKAFQPSLITSTTLLRRFLIVRTHLLLINRQQKELGLM